MPIYSVKEISAKARARVDEYVPLEPDETLVLFYDSSLWSRGTSGLLVTSRRLVDFTRKKHKSYWYENVMRAEYASNHNLLMLETSEGRRALQVLSANREKLNSLIGAVKQGIETGVVKASDLDKARAAAVANAYRQVLDEVKPGQFAVADRAVVCSHCQHEYFDRRQAQLNTAAMTAMNLDWLNASAAVLQCRNCGHLMWFINQRRG